MYSNLISNGIIFDIEETAVEILFKFKANNLDKLEQFIKPRTSTPNRSPFSVKNLRKQYNKDNKNTEDGGNKYVISNEKQVEYKEITSQISRDDISVYNKINKGFLVVLSKKMRKSVDTLKSEMKMKNLKFKEYVNFLGDDYWNKYLEYIKNYLKENQ